MTLYRQTLLPNGNVSELPICKCPDSLLSSRTGLQNFFRLHAARAFGGREGRDWRIISEPRALVPLHVNQLVPGPTPGTMDYGESLIVK